MAWWVRACFEMERSAFPLRFAISAFMHIFLDAWVLHDKELTTKICTLAHAFHAMRRLR